MKRAFAVVLLLFCALAWSRPVAKVTDRGESLVLHDTRGTCPEGAYEVYWRTADYSAKFHGCWAVVDRRVHIDWDDKDTSDLPYHLFEPMPEL